MLIAYKRLRRDWTEAQPEEAWGIEITITHGEDVWRKSVWQSGILHPNDQRGEELMREYLWNLYLWRGSWKENGAFMRDGAKDLHYFQFEDGKIIDTRVHEIFG